MTNDVYHEVVKALAYGKTPAEISEIMEVPQSAVEEIPAVEVEAKRAELKVMGYIR